MRNDTRTPEEIERDIERHRAQLTSTLGGLQDKFSVDSMVREIGDQFRTHGGDIGQSVARTVKDNPVGVALIGAGLAWLAFGGSSSGSGSGGGYGRSARAASLPNRPVESHREVQATGRYTPGNSGRHVPSWARDNDHSVHSGETENFRSDVYGSETDASGGSRMDAMKRSAEKGYGDVKRKVSEMRSRVSQGTEHMSDDARARVLAARERAIHAYDAAQVRLQQGGEVASDFYSRQPLVVGALAMAIGAAVGGSIPRTRTEDDLYGKYSDDLFHEAERIYHEERAKAEKVVRAAADEAKDIASETKSEVKGNAPDKDSLQDRVGHRLSDAGDRVRHAAEDKAEEVGLGKPSV